jgi:hypothetical protein
MRRFFKSIATLGCTAGLALGLAAIGTGPCRRPGNAMSQTRAALLRFRAGRLHGGRTVQYGQRHRRGERRHWRGPRQRGGSSFYFHFGPAPRYHAPPPRYRHAPPRQAYRLPAAHVRWCHNRYRSYRAWDNTFQPYNGPRRQCRSPYF